MTTKVYIVKGLDWTGYGHHRIVGYYASLALAKTALAAAKVNPPYPETEEYVLEAHTVITE